MVKDEQWPQMRARSVKAQELHPQRHFTDKKRLFSIVYNGYIKNNATTEGTTVTIPISKRRAQNEAEPHSIQQCQGDVAINLSNALHQKSLSS